MGYLIRIAIAFILLMINDKAPFVRSFFTASGGGEITQRGGRKRRNDFYHLSKRKKGAREALLNNVAGTQGGSQLSGPPVIDGVDKVENASCSDDHGDDHRDDGTGMQGEETGGRYASGLDLFQNDCLQLKQWYLGQEVREKWKEKHVENVRSNYEKVLLNNKYNELFNMYRNIKKNNVENYKKRVKTNRINPVIYVKKRLVSATAKYIKMSFMKTRKILWKIRYMPIIKAFAFLYYYGTNKYTVNIYKCIKSCLFNAINKYGRNNIKPVFHTLQANMGGYTKKINIRAKGKTDIIREPHTHIRVVLEV
ncbi:50S ribosomal protein L22, apicoplast, putative [Plasmodium knowlesi strain H]|uniref:50S ribosomal protein L22, apicoplast, putative n=3 Tax=Plasmodium knowlesi TaxID=5850 RepID=A0A5K1VA68_PLAKH|nr:50S ribosomal protein L22, apicoplast, putative [Plasmodium knowlesi strain H]OTN65714.1 putative 50S ribosomal protein L22 - apicoplast [Plasmodium knowlesi]CAA9989465.1 50S ribosomal protein L22, apicoplast, putative [Plasmodium knowlesi strain H]SBO25114.1 50S ribosomal protein L22, apicoplast, putative [Plasmodium knowlesi strain H]SBO27807.1 50S ribosomal protein L22, apicoplast, putative [Plasmodium knowlesi strain H]VVS78939.1 50S ribosomal protein L22, apicoplast, putative [Plasmodi|eukprot:XP_002260191.1 Ribosomal protein L22/L17e, putative [Plasmodium knowlesi strain H]